MNGIRARAAAVLLGAAALVPGGLLAQECGLAPGAGVMATVGQVSYDQLQEVSGQTYGIDGMLPLARVSVQGGYRRAVLGGADVDIGRLAMTVPLPFHLLPLPLGRLTVCATGHAGAARLPVGGDAMLVLTGGAGLRLAVPFPVGAARAVSWGEVRGLAGRSTGSLFGSNVGATGLSLGVEGGLRATLGRVTLGVAGSLDGFDDGLGISPYPTSAAELAVGIRF